MLGKGLEALIPPSNSGNDRNDEAARDIRPHVDDHSPPAPVQGEPNASIREREAHAPRRPAKSPDAIFHIEVEKIRPNPHQPRRDFDEEGIRELASSIREFGLLQPIVVTKVEREVPTGTEVEYELIAGERRLHAVKLLGLERVPAIIRHVTAERERLELAIIENIQRAALNPIEVARAFQELQEQFRLTQREIAARVGKSRESVANTMRLLDLPTGIREALERGEITESHGRLLLAIEDPGAQQKLFEDLLTHEFTTRELKRRVRSARLQESGAGREQAHSDPLVQELKMFEERLSGELGAPVAIEARGESGRIMIRFYSREELEHILARLKKESDGL